MALKKPSLTLHILFGGGVCMIGMLFLLVSLHLFAIKNTGDVASVLSTLFTVFLTIYVAMVIFGFIYLIILLLKWITYQAITPQWLKDKQKSNQNSTPQRYN